MSATKIQHRAPHLAAEYQASVFGTSALFTGSFTVPARAHGIWVYPSAACHVNPIGAATSTFQHAYAANVWFYIEKRHIATTQVIGDSGAINAIAVYERGSGRQDGGGSVAPPL